MLLLLACAPPPGADTTSPGASPSLTEVLGADEVRAGVVTDPASLIGGVSAEGRVGDVKLYNDRVRFVIQQPGDSSYYAEYGGTVIDADIVRADGVPGRDLVDELAIMVGLGRVVDAEAVTVLDAGADGVARVRVEGPTAPLHLITGALENTSIVPDLDLWVTTDYELSPGAWSVKVVTTVQSRESADVDIAIGDVGIVSLDAGELYSPGAGLQASSTAPMDWSAVIGQRNEVAVALLGEDAALEQGSIGQMLGALAQVISGFGPTATLPAGGTLTWTHFIGVAPDPATLTGEQLLRRGVSVESHEGVVTDPSGAPVPGARVHVIDGDGAPVTVAFADDAGRWGADLAPGAWRFAPTARGPGIVVDLPAGHGWYAPYDTQGDDVLATLQNGAPPIPFTDGCGVGGVYAEEDAASDPLTVPGCGRVHVEVADGGPAVVRLYAADGVDDVLVDSRIVPGRPSDAIVVGFIRDGAMDLTVEPGDYLAVVYRGVREEVWSAPVRVDAGGTTTLSATLALAYSIDGVVSGDPHSHAAPSADGGIPMEDRLVVTAANGIDVHFGTDHDHVVDYRPLLAPLGLDARLRSVVADEVSPVLRGHFNAWPAVKGDGPNGGAPLWWFGYADTQEIFGWMRALVGPAGVIQANHPVGSSGMYSFADYDPTTGIIGKPDHWSDDFTAMEVLNSGDFREFLPYYLDLVRRGKRVTPLGVSDSHTHVSGRVGLDQTFFLTGKSPAETTDADLVHAIATGATVVSQGPFVDVRFGDTPAPGRIFRAPRVVPHITVYAPSWIPVEQVTVWVDGEATMVLPCTGSAPRWCDVAPMLSFAQDASVVVTADSPTLRMSLAHLGDEPWGLSAAFFVDVDGDGVWTAPYPALVKSTR